MQGRKKAGAMYNLSFTPIAWEQYIGFQNDKRMSAKINALLKDIARNPFDGLGKIERLKGNFSGHYSRRIDSKHRIVYRINDKSCEIVQIGGHYDDK